ncbi:hypothetical protein BpHYR1_046192 [Brachionus plicatilis]|uniref:Uncharacterized protein n=1 Tax=Brachionus plicatilis TaxID=10195 RepID=A0A3M7Q2Y2_BRAPC|nr:hypothetical protein BpHYR1_046192 [Brachionus plicatilis]
MIIISERKNFFGCVCINHLTLLASLIFKWILNFLKFYDSFLPNNLILAIIWLNFLCLNYKMYPMLKIILKKCNILINIESLKNSI